MCCVPSSPGISWKGCCLPAAALSQWSSTKWLWATIGRRESSSPSLADRWRPWVNVSPVRIEVCKISNLADLLWPTSCGWCREIGAPDVLGWWEPREVLSSFDTASGKNPHASYHGWESACRIRPKFSCFCVDVFTWARCLSLHLQEELSYLNLVPITASWVLDI